MASHPASHCIRRRRMPAVMATACIALLVSACAETRFAVHAAKQLAPDREDSIVGTYKVGNPYQVNGVWYRPEVDYRYAETGIASWYGPQFHNRRTANGQIFDMNAITAAHRTLPLPSIVRVTNLENGRSLKVLVNDRGPFARGRIIDVSRRTAQLLGFEREGTAPVRVEIVPDESRRIALIAQGRGSEAVAAAAPEPVAVAALPDPAPAAGPVQTPAPVVTRAVALSPVQPAVTTLPVAARTRLFVQAGAFVQRDLADRLRRALDTIGPTQVVEAVVGARRFYRVRVGPLPSVADGDRILDRVVANGYTDARLVVD